MPLERAAELNDLGLLDAAGVDLELGPVQAQSADHQETIKSKKYLNTGVFPTGAHVRTRVGRVLSPLSLMKTMVRRSALAFLSRAIPAVASGGSWLHPVRWPGVPDADSRIRYRSANARHDSDGTSRR